MSAAQKVKMFFGPRVFFVSKTQEIVMKMVMEIIQMLDILIYLLQYLNKARMKVYNERKKQKLTLIGFSDV